MQSYIRRNIDSRIIEYIKNYPAVTILGPRQCGKSTSALNLKTKFETFNALLGHPVSGPSWEGLVIENVLSELSDWRGSFYRTSSGTEIDLIIEKGQKKIAIECKASTAPDVSKGFWNALEDLKIKEAWIIAPVKESYKIKKHVTVSPLHTFISEFK